MKVYERLAHAIVAEGINTVFGQMGNATMHWANELHKLGVKLVEVRHEGVGVGMADGWARATNTPAVAHATSGPGVTQLASALVTASRAGSPLVVFCGEDVTTDYDSVHHYDQKQFAAACESGYIRVDAPDVVDDAVRRAFYRARRESRPILLSAPQEVQAMVFDDDDPYVPSGKHFSPQRSHLPDPDLLEKAADIIAASSKPAILVGRGAIWSGADDAVIKLSERVGAIIATSLRAKTWLADKSDYHVGVSGHFATRTALQLLGEADCVIAVGASMNRFTMMRGFLFQNARFVHIDAKPDIILGIGRGADCYIQSEARLGIEGLEKALAKRSIKITGFRTPDVKARIADGFSDPAEFPIEAGTVDPREACKLLDAIVPAHVNLCGSTGAVNGFTNLHLNRARPVVMACHFFGCTGQFLPAAMGAIMATGNQPMMLVDGDSSTMMHLSDFDTAVRHQLPLLVVVFNDQALGAERHHMTAGKMNADLANIPSPDIGHIARAFGGRGCLARNLDELRAGAEEWVKNPGPMIIDLRISRNVVPVTTRRTHYAKDE